MTLVKITTKHASYSLATFVTHKRFAVLFFLPPCCVNSLILTNEPDPSSDRTRAAPHKERPYLNGKLNLV